LNALNDCSDLAECKQVQKDYEIGLLDEIRIDYDKVSLISCKKVKKKFNEKFEIHMVLGNFKITEKIN
jgi:hypothetical protein